MYLDYAAATPLDPRVLDAMRPYFEDKFYNPSSPYAPAVAVRREYEDAKHRLAVCIGGKGDEIIITAGATESINLALNMPGHKVTSSIEHPAVLETIKRGEHTLVSPDEKGIIHAEAVGQAIRADTTIVSIALANNELGTVQPLRAIAGFVESERLRRKKNGEKTPLYFHSDASQGVGQIDVHVARLGIDMITINSGKIYGPKQVALLWAAPHVRLKNNIFGGGQERGLRSGTENVPGVMGFAKALELAVDHRNSESKRLGELRDNLQKNLEQHFPAIIVSGHKKLRLPGHLHISFPGLDAERLIFALEVQDVYVATGSACAANKGTRSHVLTAIGMPEAVADGSLRITLGRHTTAEDIENVSRIIREVVDKEIKRVGQ